MAESPKEYSRATPQEYARTIVEQCRSGNLVLVYELAVVLDSKKVRPEEVGTTLHEVRSWLVAQALKWWRQVKNERNASTFSLTALWLHRLTEILVDTQKFSQSELWVTLGRLDITREQLDNELSRFHEEHSLDDVELK